MNAETDTDGADGTGRKQIVQEAPTVTAVTRISAPVEDVWRVLVAFDQYAQWHPVLSLDAKPEQVVVGAEVPGRIAGDDTGQQDVTMRIVDLEAPRRLVWEGGSLDAILGRHSFVLTPQPDGTTELTDSEEFFGAAVAELIPTLDQLREEYSRYGAALQARVERLSA
ncbi:SRPBCC domain-containing protein [Streptomyces sp. NPDC079189]|uniref:SRPBCC domain-containing protein n=1 Tax=Streptomyces sp. NPDC079189 TaxID=3154514 RepID=UPI0034382268